MEELSRTEIILGLIAVILILKDILQDRIKHHQFNIEDVQTLIRELRPIVTHTPTTADDQVLDFAEDLLDLVEQQPIAEVDVAKANIIVEKDAQ